MGIAAVNLPTFSAMGIRCLLTLIGYCLRIEGNQIRESWRIVGRFCVTRAMVCYRRCTFTQAIHKSL